MIHGIRLVNFGNHKDSTLGFGAITALVGRNGAGKTTVLRGIRQLALNAVPLPVMVDPLNLPNFSDKLAVPRHFVRMGETHFGLGASGPGQYATYGKSEIPGEWGLAVNGKSDQAKSEDVIPVEAKWMWKPGEKAQTGPWVPDVGPARYLPEAVQKSRFAELKENLKKANELGEVIRPGEPPVVSPVSHPPQEWVSEILDCQYLHGVGVNLNKPSYTTDDPPRLSSTGENLPSVIAYLMTAEPDRFAELSEALRRLIPFIKRLRVRPAKVKKQESRIVTVNRKDVIYPDEREYNGHELLFDLKSGTGVPASVVSEGTLLILALLTIFHTSDAPRLVLIDDVEQALHPWAQRLLVEHFRSLQKVRPNLQMIVTTHSPYIIDELDPSEVWMLAEDKAGTSIAKRFDAHPDLERAKGVLTTGEFWSAGGEEWITGSASKAE